MSNRKKTYSPEFKTNLKQENDALANKLGRTTVERDWAAGKLRSLGSSTKKGLVDSKPSNSSISIARQCVLPGLNRSSLYCKPKPTNEADPKATSRIDDIFANIPSTYGYRFMHRQLLEDGFKIGRNKVPRLTNRMGIQAIFPKKRKLTSIKNHEHNIYPYLLKELDMNHSNRVRSGDITYIPTRKGFMYLAAIIDWHSRSILSWKLSNCMDTALATDVPKDAPDRYGAPECHASLIFRREKFFESLLG